MVPQNLSNTHPAFLFDTMVDIFPSVATAFDELCESCGFSADHTRRLLGLGQDVPNLTFGKSPSWMALFTDQPDNCELWYEFAAASEEDVFGPVADALISPENGMFQIPTVGIFHPWQADTPQPTSWSIGSEENPIKVDLSWAHVFALSFLSSTIETPELPVFRNEAWVRTDSEACDEFYAVVAKDKNPFHALASLREPVWRKRRVTDAV
ncbi:MAG: hypothetical protein CMP20_04540 [Rickettsiales bacterium]|nr:hypothetical protein [Rickettsiales bacterium]